MERNIPLNDMGDRIRAIRKEKRMNQVKFYRFLYPDKDAEEDNIKKKMNAIENGKLKRIDFEFLLRLHEKFDVSIDFLLGYDTKFPNYDNKAASEYTGLSSEAVKQLHFWSKYRDAELPEYTSQMGKKEYKEYLCQVDRINESKWILYIVSKLLEKETKTDEIEKIADISVLYDIYMMSLDAPKTIIGIPEDIVCSNISSINKVMSSVRIVSDGISYSDSMGETHSIDIGKINQQVWRERLLNDIDDFIASIKRNNVSE